jgi:GH25 family lysozyme M1 (1,4-beta-N-acetylmuramidase)
LGRRCEQPSGSLLALARRHAQGDGGRDITASRTRSFGRAAALALLVLLVASPAFASGDGALGATGDAATGDAATPDALVLAQPPGSVPGIDVSHWQGSIDWVQVAAAGMRFAIAKATDGQDYVDPTYATNKAGAELNGIAFGAYHFARPDTSANDAVLEADHFVDNADLGPGNLIPVLDIEKNEQNMTQAKITAWILDWLDRVTERLGVRPMVYTSPHGWLTRTGDTTAVADAGYTVLWVAHWDVAQPTLPAAGWSGNGWTFWQYSSHGSVAGIVGDVDLDWYESDDFGPVTIGTPDGTPPSAAIALPAAFGDPVTVTFSEVVHHVTPDNTFVWSPGTGSYPPLDLACRSGKGAPADCVSGNVRTVTIMTREPLVLGETYEAVVNPSVAPTLVVDRSGNPAPTSTQAFATTTTVEQDSSAIAYGWRSVSKPDAYGGSYAVEHRAGATASFDFSGGAITWYTAVGPAAGKASVRIDGDVKGTFDLYARHPDLRVGRTFNGLGSGPHTITIRVLGRARGSASDTRVAVDAFRAGGDTVSNPDLRTAWGSVAYAGASAGTLWSSDLARSSVELAFSGTAIDWMTMRGPDQGRAEVSIDGLVVGTVDNYAANKTFGVTRSFTGLSEGVHTLRIVVRGDARPASDDELVSIDGFSVVP